MSESEPRSTDEIEYRDVSGYLGYRVGTDGSVWSCWERYYFKGQGKTGSGVRLSTTWKKLKPVVLRDGYCVVTLRRGEKRFNVKVHKLVLEAFVGERPDGKWAAHYPDKDRSNNALSNLRWATPQENTEDRDEHGTTAKGETSGQSKLTDDDVLSIRYAKKFGLTDRGIARLFGVWNGTINAIVRGLRWNHLPL